jgi:DNA-binding GntR family transcriptional regulator
MKQANKTNHAYEEIRKHILSRTLEPGERLVERTWAQKLAVNRADIRQALARLVGEGLLETGKKRGVFVPLPDSGREAEFLRARLALEIGAAYLAVKNATADDLTELDQIVELMRNLADRGMYAGFCEADFHFHEVLVRSAHSSHLMDIYHRANFPLTLFSPRQSRQGELLHRDARRHQGLLKALQQRNFSLLARRLAECYEF